eukprot:GHVH01002704.1.p1 GENE.GHVH01002704.1~~GHVH01002704.1.p1  ORF type:complete len:976 (+),score=150.73 GHVH01002704.1:115-3042(+)
MATTTPPPHFGTAPSHIEYFVPQQNYVRELKSKGIATVYPWQAECLTLKSGILLNSEVPPNLFFRAPTSGGKSLIGDILMIRWMNRFPKKAVLLVLPFVSLVNERASYLTSLLSDKTVVQLHQGVNLSVDSHFDVVVATPERVTMLFSRWVEQAASPVQFLERFSCVVVDEIHLVGESGGRGVLLELLVARLLLLQKRSPKTPFQVIAMTATLSNAEDFERWLSSANGLVSYSADTRPVQLEQLIALEGKISLVESSSAVLQPVIEGRRVGEDLAKQLTWKLLTRSPPAQSFLTGDLTSDMEGALTQMGNNLAAYRPEALTRDDDIDEQLASVVWKMCMMNKSIIVFASSKQKVEYVANKIAKRLPILFKNISELLGSSPAPCTGDFVAVGMTPSGRHSGMKTEFEQRSQFVSANSKSQKSPSSTISTKLLQLIGSGVAYHHSGISLEEKKIVEEAYKTGVIRVLVCTSTLATGVNLPADCVILNGIRMGKDYINTNQYRQMAGRAGRTGLCESGTCVVFPNSRKEFHAAFDLMTSPPKSCHSNLSRGNIESEVGLQSLLMLSCQLNQFIKASIPHHEEGSEELSSSSGSLVWRELKESTLWGKQSVERNENEDSAIHEATQALIAYQMLEYSTSSKQLSLTVLGEATVSSSLSPWSAVLVAKTLKECSSKLQLCTDFHLIYLCAPPLGIPDPPASHKLLPSRGRPVRCGVTPKGSPDRGQKDTMGDHRVVDRPSSLIDPSHTHKSSWESATVHFACLSRILKHISREETFVVANILNIPIQFIHMMAVRECSKFGTPYHQWPHEYRSSVLYLILVRDTAPAQLAAHYPPLLKSDHESFVNAMYTHGYAVSHIAQKLGYSTIESCLSEFLDRVRTLRTSELFRDISNVVATAMVKSHDVRSASDILLTPVDQIVNQIRHLTDMSRRDLIGVVSEIRTCAGAISKKRYAEIQLELKRKRSGRSTPNIKTHTEPDDK